MKAQCLLRLLAAVQMIGTSRGFQVGTHHSHMPQKASSRMMSSVTPVHAATSDAPKVLNGLRDLVDNYDIFLLDMWGVMHDGTKAYEGVLEAVTKLKEAGKELIILSNSSKRRDNSFKVLKKLGFDPHNDFTEIVTSGEVSYHLISNTSPDESPLAPQPWYLLESVHKSAQKRVFCFGSGAGDEEYLTSSGWMLSDMDNADVIVARGTFTILDGTTVIDKTKDGEEAYFEAYHEQLAKAAERKIPMIIANPDKIRPDADRSPMPGTIGNAYEKALGDDSSNNKSGLIKYIGKPFSDVYEIALRDRDRSRACMIGDALETDVTGGQAEGIDAIWVVKDGIHFDDIQSRGYDSLEEGCNAVLSDFNNIADTTYAEGRQLSPTIILPNFRW